MNKISDIFKPISPDYIGADLDNKFQLYNLIEWILQQTGPAALTVVSFSMSEEFIRKMLKLQKSGLLKSCAVILDFKAVQKTQKIIRFANNVFSSVSYCKTHAKIVLIETDNLQFPGVIITGSQNATRGNRSESTVITTDEETFYKLKLKIESLTSMTYDVHTNTDRTD